MSEQRYTSCPFCDYSVSKAGTYKRALPMHIRSKHGDHADVMAMDKVNWATVEAYIDGIYEEIEEDAEETETVSKGVSKADVAAMMAENNERLLEMLNKRLGHNAPTAQAQANEKAKARKKAEAEEVETVVRKKKAKKAKVKNKSKKGNFRSLFGGAIEKMVQTADETVVEALNGYRSGFSDVVICLLREQANLDGKKKKAISEKLVAEGYRHCMPSYKFGWKRIAVVPATAEAVLQMARTDREAVNLWMTLVRKENTVPDGDFEPYISDLARGIAQAKYNADPAKGTAKKKATKAKATSDVASLLL